MTGVKGMRSGFAVMDKKRHLEVSAQGGSKTKKEYYAKAVHKSKKHIDSTSTKHNTKGVK